MPAVVAIVETNEVLRNKIVETCKGHKKLHVQASVAGFLELKHHLETQPIDVVIIGENTDGLSHFSTIEEIIKSYPLPILLVNIKKGVDTNFHELLNLGFIDTIELDQVKDIMDINVPRMLAIKTVILSKLNMDKFQYQIKDYFNEEVISFKIPENVPVKQLVKAVEQKNRKILSSSGNFSSKDIIIIGASTGGPTIIQYIIQHLPTEFPAILIVQHMPSGFVVSFAKRLNRLSKIVVQEAEEGDVIRKGNVYIAPGGKHMEIYLNDNNLPTITLTDGPTVNFVKPAVDVTLFSAARFWGSGVISVILTGMGKDGKEGTKEIKKLGGRSLVLNEEDSVIYGMNKSVVSAGLADEILSLTDIPLRLAEIYGFKVE